MFKGTFYIGTSSSKLLFEIIIRLHKAEMKGGLILHVIHVAGTRQKEAGIDGLSRRDLLEGILAGRDTLSHIPLGAGALERSGGDVEIWIRGR